MPMRRRILSTMRRLCMSRASRHRGASPACDHVTRSASPSGPVGRCEQQIFLAVNRNRTDVADRLVAQIGDAGFDFALPQHVQKHVRGAAQHGEAHVRMAHLQRNCEFGDQRHRGRNRSDAQMATPRRFSGRECPAASRVASPTSRCAHTRTRSPSGVKPWKREARFTSGVLSICSRLWMPSDNVGCATPQLSAARPKCCSRDSAIMNSSFSSIALPHPGIVDFYDSILANRPL